MLKGEEEKRKLQGLYTLAPLLQNHSRWLSPQKKKKAIDTNDSGISQTLGENCSLIKFIFLIINKEQNVRVYIKITMPLYVLMVTTKGNRNNGHTSPRTSSPYQPPRLSE